MQLPARAFTVQADGRLNELVTEAHISEAFDLSTTPTPPTPPKTFRATWDTGATNTVITQKVIDDCGLKPVGMVMAQTVQGSMLTPTYLISIALPNHLGIAELRVARGSMAGDSDVLVGMDIISAGDFAVTNKDGKTTFSFRTPSVERIDFVEQQRSMRVPQIAKAPPRVGRNEPCPCGSGKKYKKCCGK